MLFYANLNLLASHKEDLSHVFSVILWILPPVSTVSFLHPDPRQLPQGLDPPKPFLKSIPVPSAIVPSYSKGN